MRIDESLPIESQEFVFHVLRIQKVIHKHFLRKTLVIQHEKAVDAHMWGVSTFDTVRLPETPVLSKSVLTIDYEMIR